MTMTLASAAFGCSTRPTELDWDGLRCAARTYFPNGRGVSPTAKGELDTAFYVGLDLAQRAQAWTVADRRLHAAAFNALRRYIPPRISTPFDEHRRMVVAGCGDGRLARAYIRAAATSAWTSSCSMTSMPSRSRRHATSSRGCHWIAHLRGSPSGRRLRQPRSRSARRPGRGAVLRRPRDHRSEFRRSPSSPSTPVLFGRGEQPSSRWLVRRGTHRRSTCPVSTRICGGAAAGCSSDTASNRRWRRTWS